MAATITWKVGTMECYPQYEQNTDVVFTVHWDCLGAETVNNITYNGRVYGSTGVTYHSGSEFTPYDQLSESQVLGWVWDSMGTEQKNNYETNVQTQINNQINPPVVILPLPWTPISIAQQPVSATVEKELNITFTVVASGPANLSYQWFKNNTIIDNAVNSSYTINNVQDSDAGNYTVTVSGNNGQSVTSNPATLNVIPPIPQPATITEQPASQTVTVGDGVVFNVNATGNQPLSYQWFKDDVAIEGGTGNTFIIQTVTLTDAGSYKATVTNSVNTTTSNIATLTVNE